MSNPRAAYVIDGSSRRAVSARRIQKKLDDGHDREEFSARHYCCAHGHRLYFVRRSSNDHCAHFRHEPSGSDGARATNKSNSAFVAVAKSHGDVVFSTAIKQKQFVVIDNSLIRLDFVQEHTVEKHPTACVFQLGRGVDRNGNVCSSASCAANLYAFTSGLAESSYEAWAKLSKHTIVCQKRPGEHAYVRHDRPND